MTVTKRNLDDCYVFELKRVHMGIALVGFIIAVVGPLMAATSAWVRVNEQLARTPTREEVAATYLSRAAADAITGQRNMQLSALNDNIVAIATNQDVLNSNMQRLMGKMGVDSTSAMRPIPNVTLPILRNPEPPNETPKR